VVAKTSSQIPINGLSLWLKADAGVNKLSYIYTSQIVLSGTSTPNVNGTYTANGVPAYGNEYPSVVDSYSFTAPSGKIMFWDAYEQQYRVFLDGSGNAGGFGSSDGVNWGPVENYISEIVISGCTGIYALVNGSYYWNNGFWNHSSGNYYIQDGALLEAAYSSVIATNNQNYSGAWTPTTITTQVTLAGAGSESINGVYGQSDSIEPITSWNGGQAGGYIYKDGGTYYVTNDDWSNAYKSDDLLSWTLDSGGIAPSPTGSLTNTARSMGSPTSTVIYAASGSISGAVTISTVNTNNLIGWADQSGSGNNATARTGSVSVISNSLNSKPVLHFDGTSNLITNSFYSIDWNSSITVIAVSKASASTVRGEQPTARYIASVTNNGGYEYGLSYGAYETEFPNFSNSYGISYVGGADIESTAMGENEVKIATSINSGGTISYYLNGSSVGSASSSDWSGYSPSVGSFAIGSNAVLDETDGFFSVCDVAEIIIYNRAVSSTERQQVEAYLNAKYGVY
jgi:hypothetical protein